MLNSVRTPCTVNIGYKTACLRQIYSYNRCIRCPIRFLSFEHLKSWQVLLLFRCDVASLGRQAYGFIKKLGVSYEWMTPRDLHHDVVKPYFCFCLPIWVTNFGRIPVLIFPSKSFNFICTILQLEAHYRQDLASRQIMAKYVTLKGGQDRTVVFGHARFCRAPKWMITWDCVNLQNQPAWKISSSLGIILLVHPVT